jgi:hypothetical protein
MKNGHDKTAIAPDSVVAGRGRLILIEWLLHAQPTKSPNVICKACTITLSQRTPIEGGECLASLAVYFYEEKNSSGPRSCVVERFKCNNTNNWTGSEQHHRPPAMTPRGTGHCQDSVSFLGSIPGPPMRSPRYLPYYRVRTNLPLLNIAIHNHNGRLVELPAFRCSSLIVLRPWKPTVLWTW